MTKETIEKVLKIAIENGYENPLLASLLEVVSGFNDKYLPWETNKMELIYIITSKPFIDAFAKYIYENMEERTYVNPEANTCYIDNMGDMHFMKNEHTLQKIISSLKSEIMDAIYGNYLEDVFTGLIN